MSELINMRRAKTSSRWQLLASASGLALLVGILATSNADADDSRPTVWIELGGQLERQTGQGDSPILPFVSAFSDSPAFQPLSPEKFQSAPRYSQGLEGSISFEPLAFDWSFHAAIRYGRSGGRKSIQQGQPIIEDAKLTQFPNYAYTPSGAFYYIPPPKQVLKQEVYEFGGFQTKRSQSHMVLDFTAGKDVGLGMFGNSGSSSFDIGVRFAQFISKSSSIVRARPDSHFSNPCHPSYAAFFGFPPSSGFEFCQPIIPGYHTFAATSYAERSFRGIGPTIAWNGSISVLHHEKDTGLFLDVGVNASVLFGRQKASGSHQTSGHYNPLHGVNNGYYLNHSSFDRSRRVVTPNLGGSIGASLKFPNAKIILGYRGDFFLGAMDTGVDERKTKTVGFYGPFATISIGFP